MRKTVCGPSVGVTVGVGVMVGVGVVVDVGVTVAVGVTVGVTVAVPVSVGVGVDVAVGVTGGFVQRHAIDGGAEVAAVAAAGKAAQGDGVRHPADLQAAQFHPGNEREQVLHARGALLADLVPAQARGGPGFIACGQALALDRHRRQLGLGGPGPGVADYVLLVAFAGCGLQLAPLSNTPLQLPRLPSRHQLGVASGQRPLQPRPASAAGRAAERQTVGLRE